jgi:hypothetical protein
MSAIALVSFGGAFGVTFLIKKSRPPVAAVPVDDVSKESTQGSGSGRDYNGDYGLDMSPRSEQYGGHDLTREMTEKQLKNLIFDIRSEMKMRLAKDKVSEKRIELARDALRQDIEELRELRENLASAVTYLKDREASLKNLMLEVATTERANMTKIAGRYDKMGSREASTIMIMMNKNNQLEDVVLILYYMDDKTGAKLLGEIAKTEPLLASVLTTQLKRVKESG